ncbi:Tetratricopeptide repeat-containing protein [Cognatiyoonia sediminum]|uniref:Tetratricopeptide repeat-containing protein n=1 Tax=Cognatiyoonia sediminum TaxID=1508389 RepID=A0A1M5PZF9_9RHOB|nr:tetratricopeptide repeat protein [Cognatiyoonia sediminum]SHH07255.1 Tetratricopeptide repeat-containing protein [Cognatiyoonia sediminum]
MVIRFLRAAALISATTFSAPVSAEIDPGSYLAARHAAMSNDFLGSARYYTKSLLSDPFNPELLENALTAYLGLGQLDRAEALSVRLLDRGEKSQIATIVRQSGAAGTENWDSIFFNLEAGQTISPLVDMLIQAWAELGRGDVTAAMATFDGAIENPQTRTFALYHKALALAAVGDFEAAEELFRTGDNGQAFSARSAIAHAQVLSQLERNEDALIMLGQVFGQTRNPGVLDLRAKLENGETVPYSVVQTAQQGVGEVMFMVSELLSGDTPDGYTLMYTRAAEHLDPGNTAAILSSGRLLDNLEQYDLASETYSRIPQDDPSFVAAELGRVDVLRRAERHDAAAEVASNLVRLHPDIPAVHAKLGDSFRRLERYEEAADAYSDALDLFSDADTARWLVYYTRAITNHELDRWPEAEADFRAALDINPDQPQVLNYLGYSLVERKEKLDEAMGMIETAVAAQPNNGAIVDSLGWVLFQLGRYEEAVSYMERAASLEAVDPIITDHLGDVYWSVGRKIEAVFQWNRALSFEPDEELADRIRRKLDVGLDAVLEAEGGEPIKVADDDS